MVDILHRVGISAPASSVYESFTTIDGLSRWWTNTLTGDPRPAGTKWAYFLLGLNDDFEGGKATPFPDDEHISSWG